MAQGETLWGIAQAWGITLGELLAKNPQLKNPNVIQPGASADDAMRRDACDHVDIDLL